MSTLELLAAAVGGEVVYCDTEAGTVAQWDRSADCLRVWQAEQCGAGVVMDWEEVRCYYGLEYRVASRDEAVELAASVVTTEQEG